MNKLYSDLLSVLEKLRLCRSREQILEILEHLPKTFYIQFVSYRSFTMSRGPAFNPVRLSTFPADWFAHYNQITYAHSDPMISACRQSFEPCEWSQISENSLVMSQILTDAKRFNVSPIGISYPIYGPRREFAVVSISVNLNQDDWNENKESLIPVLQILSMHLHEASMQVISRLDREPVSLSSRETECISFAARGKRAKQIAAELGLAEQTVNFHLNLARRKLGAANTTEAAVIATEFGLIDILEDRSKEAKAS